MRTFLGLFVVITSLLLATEIRAQDDTPAIIDLPIGEIIFQADVNYKAFTLEEYKIIALIYNDYIFFRNQTVSLKQSLQLQLDIQTDYKLQLEGLERIIKIQDSDRKYWTTRLSEEQVANKRRELSSSFERFGLWALVVVEAIALGSLGIYAASQ